MLKSSYIKKKLSRRFFLTHFSLIFIFPLFFYKLNKLFINRKKNNNDSFIKKNYYFAKKTYRLETVQIIFKSYFNRNINAKDIMNNITERRKLNMKRCGVYKKLKNTNLLKKSFMQKLTK